MRLSHPLVHVRCKFLVMSMQVLVRSLRRLRPLNTHSTNQIQKNTRYININYTYSIQCTPLWYTCTDGVHKIKCIQCINWSLYKKSIMHNINNNNNINNTSTPKYYNFSQHAWFYVYSMTNFRSSLRALYNYERVRYFSNIGTSTIIGNRLEKKQNANGHCSGENEEGSIKVLQVAHLICQIQRCASVANIPYKDTI